jgi:hypothetical protein
MFWTELTQQQELEYQQWARDNYSPQTAINGTWHPIIQAECVKMNLEFDASVDFEDLYKQIIESMEKDNG